MGKTILCRSCFSGSLFRRSFRGNDGDFSIAVVQFYANAAGITAKRKLHARPAELQAFYFQCIDARRKQ